MPSPFKRQTYPESAPPTFSNRTANLAGALLLACLGLPALGIALLRSDFMRAFEQWELGALGALAVFALVGLAHTPAGLIWYHVTRRDRMAFVLFILAPVIVGWGVTTALAAWTLWPVLVLIALALDDVWTVMVALGLPPGGQFDEVLDGNGKRWIRVQYPNSRTEFYEPRL